MATSSSDGVDILEKLRHHPDYGQRSEEELQALAYDLTDFDCVFGRFRHLLVPAVDRAIDETLVDARTVYTDSLEVEMAHRRAKHELARVYHLPVKLFLSRLRQTIPMYSIAGKVSKFFLEYGALHAGLVVGNIRIEWGREGIVDAQPEDYIPGDDFIGTVDDKGELGQGAAETYRKFSLANRERRTCDKIELIVNTAEKKNKVLSNLVQVITSYNRDRKHDLFSCNCQHFVRDALAALGIRETPRFSGQLGDYLEHLKEGRIEVPVDFQSHATLDAYVEEQLKAAPGVLNQHDMEYLLLHYYRLHLNSMPEDDDLDEWECDVPTCMYERLADRADSLLNDQSTTDSAEAAVSVEACEEDLRRKEEQQKRKIADDKLQAREVVDGIRQDEAFEQHQHRGYHTRITEKLQDLPEDSEQERRIQVMEERMAQIEREKEEALQRATWEKNNVQQQLQATKSRVAKLEREVDEADQRAEVQTTELNVQLRRVAQLEAEVEEANHRADLCVMELSNKLELERQRAHAIQEHAEMMLRDTEAQLRQSQSYWTISRDEIEFTEVELGTGAYGTVRVVIFRGSRVAAKCYHQILLSDHNLGLFRREITMASHLRHPNLVQFIGASVERELILLTELMTTSLDVLMHRGQLCEGTVTCISLDVARALNYLHLMRPQPVVHRDICRGNVLLDPLPDNKWKAKVSDYGSVNLLEHLTTRHPGNPFYEAPEAKDPDLQSPKMDIYSFGVLLAEMLTNELPEKKHRHRQILKVEIHHPNFIRLVRQCLSEENDSRLSAQDLIADLKER